MSPWWAFTSGTSSESSILPTSTRLRCPWSRAVKRARLVFSQSCSVLRSVVRRRLPIIVLMLSLSSATSPRASTWIERVRSPLVTAVATSAMARTCVVEVGGQEVDVAGQVLPGAGGAGDVRLAAEAALDADLARHRGHLVGEGGERAGHVVDRLGERRDLALGLHGEVALQVAFGDRGHHLHDAAHLLGEVGGHDVDVVGQVLPGAGDAGHLGLAAELALGADLARHARHFGGEGVQLVDHGVDGVLELEDLALARRR